MDRDKVRDMRVDIDNVLRSVCEKHGLVHKMGSATYNDNGFYARFDFVDSQNGDTVEAVDFKEKCGKYGLKPSDLGRTFTTTNGTYRISGLKPRNRKYPIIAERVSDNKSFKFSHLTVKMSLV